MVEKLNPDDPQSFFNEHFALPPLPAVVERLISALQSGETNATEIGDLLASVPGRGGPGNADPRGVRFHPLRTVEASGFGAPGLPATRVGRSGRGETE